MKDNSLTKETGLKYGLIAGLVLIIYSLILQMSGLAAQQSLGYLSYVFFAVIIVMAYTSFKKANNGFMTFGQGLGIGVMMSGIAGFLSGAFLFIYVKYIDDSIFEVIRQKQMEELEAKGMSDEDIEKNMEMMNMFMGPVFMFIMSVIMMLILGFILSLIISAVMKKENPELEV